MRAFAEGRKTLNAVVDSCCEKFRFCPSLGMAMEKALSYGEMYERVLAVARNLQEFGVQKGDRLAILAENSPFWGVAYLSIVRLGAVVVPILPEMPESDVRHILEQMKVKAVFTTQRQIEKLSGIKKVLEGPVFTLDNFSGADFVKTIPFSGYVEDALAKLRAMHEKPVFPEVEETDLASIIYTSGTSGFSKAVMLSHGNFTANAYAASELADVEPGGVWLSILPLSHAYEFTCGFILPLIFGAKIAYTDKLPTPAILKKLCSHEKPTTIFAVPLILEKIYKKRVQPELEAKKWLRLVCKVGLFRRLIYRKIGKKLTDFFGGNLLFMGVGGAKLNPEVEQFFCEAKFPYLVGYGMTEAAPLIAGGPLFEPTIAVGSTGKPIPGVEVRIHEPDANSGIGEIQVKGQGVMQGYFNDAEKSAEAFCGDGWLATGDVGFVDDKGNLHVTGRLKSVIVMPNGENVYPEPVEFKLSTSPLVVEALVVEHGGQLEAWVYPDYELLEEKTVDWNKEKRIAFLTERLEELRCELNDDLPKTARLAKIFTRRDPFIKTPTLKIKRYKYSSESLRSEQG